jgi:AraC-like DNA-binding protein
MQNTLQIFINSLQLHFLNIKEYHFDHTWKFKSRELTYNVFWIVTEGKFTLLVNGQRYHAEAGQLLYLSRQSHIDCRRISDKTSLTSINFDAEISFLGNRVWSDMLHFPVQHAFHLEEIQSISKEMLLSSTRPSPGRNIFLQSGFLRMMSLLLDQIYQKKQGAPTVAALDSRVQSVVEYLSCHPGQFPQVRDLGALVQLSESQLRKLFLRHIGLSPLHYIHYHKVDRAKQLLSSTSMRVFEIADELGYDDPNYFSRMFKKISGMTPNQYRNRYQNWMNDA